jgi:hypothetical protein
VDTTANQITLALVLENLRLGISRIAQKVGSSGRANIMIIIKILAGIRILSCFRYTGRQGAPPFFRFSCGQRERLALNQFV